MERVRLWLSCPREIYNLLHFRMGGGTAVIPPLDQDALSDSLQTCYRYLKETSRSFAAVIQALDGELRDAGCICYLVLRALDTLEDDTTISLETRISMLHDFHTNLYQPDWRYMQSKDKHKQVLEDFPTISLEFRKLGKVYRDVIADVCRKMGAGMAEFLQRKVDSLQDWDKGKSILMVANLLHQFGLARLIEQAVKSCSIDWEVQQYCHYSLGVVYVGLSHLLPALKLEDPIIGEDPELANSLGVFLQKTHIIREYLVDHLAGLEFWPREVWSKYTKELSDLAKPENSEVALHCLNELITNALQHIPDALTFLSRLKNQRVFNFYAIPLVMAIATLAACYNNKQIFKGVVKIRKGQTVTLMMDATNIQAVKAIIYQYTEEIYRKIPRTDPSSKKTQQIALSIQTICSPSGTMESRNHLFPIYLLFIVLLAALIWQYQRATSGALEGTQATEK